MAVDEIEQTGAGFHERQGMVNKSTNGLQIIHVHPDIHERGGEGVTLHYRVQSSGFRPHC